MRTVRQSGQFKRDLKRDSKGQHRKALQTDFVLIYRKPDDLTLELVRLGSHAELGW